MKVLFFHDSQCVTGGVKPSHLKGYGHEVINPPLDGNDFNAAIQTAQAEYDQYHPDVVVGIARGGAVAINIDSKDTPLILMCPAWKTSGMAKTVKPKSIIIHSPGDEAVPFSDSEELLSNSCLPFDALIPAGHDHQLDDDSALKAMLWACSLFKTNQPLSWLEGQSQLPPHTLECDDAAFYEKVKTEFIPWIEQSTISFFHLRKDPTTDKYGIVDKDRTGVFLRIGNDHFVITASHYIPKYVDEGTYLYLSWDDEEHCPIPIASDQIATSDEKILDVAAIKLSPESSAKLLKRHTPISIQNISRYSLTSNGLFLIVGYPRAGTEFPEQNPLEKLQEPSLKSLKYIAKRTSKKWRGEDLTYSPLMHVLLGMNRDSYITATGFGELLPIHEQIQGISGCGIWLIADRRWKKSLDQIRLEHCKLIAIEHSYDEKTGIVAGTWIELVLMMIAMNFPETKPAVNLLYP